MGATQFKVRSSGKTADEAYKRACDMAELEYGTQDGYNGTISTTHGFRDETEAYKKSKLNDVSAYIYGRFDSHNMNKRDCSAICVVQPVGNKNKTKSQVEHVVTPGTKKWVLQYAILNTSNDVLSAHLTKGDAVRIARYHTEKTQEPTKIIMRKVLEDGNPLVARITYKKALTERDGEWVFFGYAAE